MTAAPRAMRIMGFGPPIEITPDTLVVRNVDVLNPQNAGHLSTFQDDSWCIHLAAEKPTAHVTVSFEEVPSRYRDSLKLAVYVATNFETSFDAIEHSDNKMQSRIKPGTVRTNYAMGWRPFAMWLEEEGGLPLCDVDTDLLNEYFDDVIGLDLTPDEKGLRLWSVTRLWLYAPYLPVQDQLVQPPWEAPGARAEVRDQLGPREPRTENRTRPIHPETMSALLACCLSLVNDCSKAILLAKAERDALVAAARKRSQPGDLGRWNSYLDDLRRTDGSLPGRIWRGKPTQAHVYLAARLNVSLNLVRTSQAKHDFPMSMGVPLDATIERGIGGRVWHHTIDFYEVDAWVRRLTAACYIVIAYLSGMRVEECRGLERDCCSRSDPDDELAGYEIHSRVFKVKGIDGNTIPGGIERDQPWYVIELVAKAIEVMQQLHSDDLLFPRIAFSGKQAKDAYLSANTVAINGAIRELVSWWNEVAEDEGWPIIPPEPTRPDGRDPRITVSRFRRTIAWFVYRLPFGLISLGIQYGHINLRQSAAYASRVESGISEVMEEHALAQVDAFEAACARFDEGEGVSGPAADRWTAGVLEFGTRYRGQVLDKRDFEALLRNPRLRIYNNENQFLTCCYDATQALCHPDNDRLPSIERSPDLTRCDPRCPNVTRLDTNMSAIEAEMAELDAEMESSLVPQPIRERARQRRAVLMKIVENHGRTRVIAREWAGDTDAGEG